MKTMSISYQMFRNNKTETAASSIELPMAPEFAEQIKAGEAVENLDILLDRLALLQGYETAGAPTVLNRDEMQKEMKKLTLGTVKSMARRRNQLERKCQEITQVLSGQAQPLLPEGWTDEDAWKLAKALAKLMAQVKRVEHTVFDEQNPCPSHDTPIEDIPYYNPYNTEDPSTSPSIPTELWEEVLHCGILIAAGRMDFCFPSKGAFADLEELFRGVVWSGGGPKSNFDSLVDWLGAELTEERCRKLKEQDFDPNPPKFDQPKDPREDTMQGGVYREWQEQAWIRRFPCLDALRQAIKRVDSLRSEAMHFINNEIGTENLLCRAIDLYLYQTGADFGC